MERNDNEEKSISEDTMDIRGVRVCALRIQQTKTLRLPED